MIQLKADKRTVVLTAAMAGLVALGLTIALLTPVLAGGGSGAAFTVTRAELDRGRLRVEGRRRQTQREHTHR